MNHIRLLLFLVLAFLLYLYFLSVPSPWASPEPVSTLARSPVLRRHVELVARYGS
jgi:hypothetical protein